MSPGRASRGDSFAACSASSATGHYPSSRLFGQATPEAQSQYTTSSELVQPLQCAVSRGFWLEVCASRGFSPVAAASDFSEECLSTDMSLNAGEYGPTYKLADVASAGVLG